MSMRNKLLLKPTLKRYRNCRLAIVVPHRKKQKLREPS